MKSGKVVVLLAEGVEEIEAITIIDVLRRAEITVAITGIDGTRSLVNGAHGIRIAVDQDISDALPGETSMVVLPGGMPGSVNLRDNPAVLDLLRAVYAQGGTVAAICAAPIALQAAGLLVGKRATCYPSFMGQLKDAIPSGNRVEVDGRVVTSRGPGTALAFALALVRHAGYDAIAGQLQSGMLVDA